MSVEQPARCSPHLTYRRSEKSLADRTPMPGTGGGPSRPIAPAAEATEDGEHLVATLEPDLGLRAPGDIQFQHNPSIGDQ
jgi:hypothetical protein